MTRFKLLLLGAVLVLTAAAARPAKSDACFAYGYCQSCTPTTSRLCLVVQCPPSPAHTSCGSCSTTCEPL